MKKKVKFTKCEVFRIYIKDEDQTELTVKEQKELKSKCSVLFKKKLNSYRQCGKFYRRAQRNALERTPTLVEMHPDGDQCAKQQGRDRRRHVTREPVSSWPVRFAREFLRHVRTFFEI